MPGHFVPRADSSFGAWLSNFVAKAVEHREVLRLSDEEVERMESLAEAWDAALKEHLAAQGVARAKRGNKDKARQDAEALMRSMAGRIRSLPGPASTLSGAMGLTIKRKARKSIPIPKTSPHAVIDFSNRLKHILRVHDTDGHTVRRARPEWTVGCEIWMKFSDEPEDTADFRFVGLATGRPTVVEFKRKDVGRTVLYKLRWVNTQGKPGTWSGIKRATVGA